MFKKKLLILSINSKKTAFQDKESPFFCGFLDCVRNTRSITMSSRSAWLYRDLDSEKKNEKKETHYPNPDQLGGPRVAILP